MQIMLKIYRDKMVLSGDGRTITVEPQSPYSSQRLLVGNFDAAAGCLKEGADKLGALGLFKRGPSWTIQPMELVEGGLSQIEERILQELALAVGGKVASIELG
ncbi:hypothetical protein [Gallaecimonas sp. GXIMD4217]|uniref:hypothetical protein n=1 Tax=Gallaecimonas sp. GXIMD4217 TaxID=3131927 RepID=UPI00311B17E0